MKLLTKWPTLFTKATVYFSTIIRFLLNILIVVIVAALAIGVYKSGYDLIHSLHKPLEILLQQILLDVIFIAALTELSITILGYLKDGAVHVRYIIDTIFIIMLNEIVSIWFKHPELKQAIGISIIILALAVVRLSVVRFEPKNTQ